jgi:hypothetical protein
LAPERTDLARRAGALLTGRIATFVGREHVVATLALAHLAVELTVLAGGTGVAIADLALVENPVAATTAHVARVRADLTVGASALGAGRVADLAGSDRAVAADDVAGAAVEAALRAVGAAALLVRRVTDLAGIDAPVPTRRAAPAGVVTDLSRRASTRLAGRITGLAGPYLVIAADGLAASAIVTTGLTRRALTALAGRVTRLFAGDLAIAADRQAPRAVRVAE